MPGVSGAGRTRKDSKCEMAEAVALRMPYLSQLRYLFFYSKSAAVLSKTSQKGKELLLTSHDAP